MAHRLPELLEAIDMPLDADTCPGLVRADEQTLAAKRQGGAPLEEIVALERARHFDAHYVYFRRITDRPPMAMAYLYDWTERLVETQRSTSKLDVSRQDVVSRELAELHRGVWSACEIPLVYVFLPTQVQIFHILQGPEADEQGIRPSPLKSIELGEELASELEPLKAFSARQLDDGRFWAENPDARALKLDGSAFMDLSRQIQDCRTELRDERGVDDELVRRLLILFVMIKYLEEREDQEGQRVFPADVFTRFDERGREFERAKGFVGLLEAGGRAVLGFLDHLAARDRFNGDVFRLSEEERRALNDPKTDLRPFAALLGGHVEGRQRTFWRRYAFGELPVELISHLYEQFLPRQPGVVYTPPFLVSFILDEVLPLSQSTPDSFRLLDPACGSGVFLVGAFKRLVHRWRRDNGFRDPDVETLKRLLRRHVFGVDIEGEAVRLTMFSLSVALCDFLRPRVIWDDLHFDYLQADNLFEGDFFAHARQKDWSGAAGFDLIVGNPPFISELTPEGEKEAVDIKNVEPDFELPDRQAALLFLKTSARIAKPGAQIALIQPSGPLLYNASSGCFRRHLFAQVHVHQIVDLSHLSRVLFKRPQGRHQGENGGPSNSADVAIAIVFAEKRAPTEEPLLHVTVRRTVQTEQKLLFEIDHYDLHLVSRRAVTHDPDIWKANFIGGGRIPHLVRRLAELRSLGEFLQEAKEERGWVSGEGYIAGSEAKAARLEVLQEKLNDGRLSMDESKELQGLRKRYREASWLTGHDTLPTKAFTAKGIDWSKVEEIKDRIFAEPRSEALFAAPLLLVKEVIEAEAGTMPAQLLGKGIRFRDQLFGIHAPKSDLEILKRAHRLFSNHRLVHFCVLATSAKYLISKSSALRQLDILRLPFPESEADLVLSPLENALVEDVVAYVVDFKRKGEDAAVQKPATADQLKQFGDFFCRVLGSVYRSLRPCVPIQMQGGICFPFCFGDVASHHFEDGEAGRLRLDKLLTTTVGSSLRCQRILRVFHGNMLFLVKPPQLRYWLRSVAVRDADEIFVELQGQGH